MQWTNYISQRIDISLAQMPTCMRAFKCKAEEFIMVFANADLFAIHFNYSNMIRGEIQFIRMFSDLMPGYNQVVDLKDKRSTKNTMKAQRSQRIKHRVLGDP
jgi:hypothetical protein